MKPDEKPLGRLRLVRVPGLLDDAELWRDPIGPLSETVQTVVADITQGASLPELARAVLDIGGPRFALAGFSLGGIVAQEVMRQAPERISHLALLDTTMEPDRPERAEERRHLIAVAQNPGRFHGFGERLVEQYLAPKNLGNTAITERIRSMTSRLGADVFIRQSLIERPDSRRTLRRIKIPALVLCGAQDRITPPALHREMAALIPGARMAIVKHAGHMTPIEAPAVVTTALQRLWVRT